MGNYTTFLMFENPRRGRQARNFTENDPKILDLKSSSEQINLLRKNHWRGRNRANPIHRKCKKMDFSQRANSKPIEKAWLTEQKPRQCALTFQRKIVTV